MMIHENKNQANNYNDTVSATREKYFDKKQNMGDLGEIKNMN